MNHLFDGALPHFIQLGVGIFTAGVAWGAVRYGVKSVDQKLDRHITETATWRGEVMSRLDSITNTLFHRGQ
jgi:hypothetical protein